MITYEVDPGGAWQDAVDRAAKAASDLRVPFALIADDFYRTQRSIWQDSGPGRYPDLSPAYKKQKQKKVGFIYPILRANGYLEVAASVQGGAGNITQIEPQRLTMGVDSDAIPYADYHQSDAPRSKIPLRKFVFYGPEAGRFADSEQVGRLDRWMKILDEFIMLQLKESGMGDVK